jgi:hypothetical protein
VKWQLVIQSSLVLGWLGGMSLIRGNSRRSMDREAEVRWKRRTREEREREKMSGSKSHLGRGEKEIADL